jgi:anti-sigma factor RsiW
VNPLRHHRLRARLDAYVDGELDAAARAAVGAHLRTCWGCSGYVELFLLVHVALHRRREPLESLAVVRLRRFADRLAPR